SYGDWSSDVCSSDLVVPGGRAGMCNLQRRGDRAAGFVSERTPPLGGGLDRVENSVKCREKHLVVESEALGPGIMGLLCEFRRARFHLLRRRTISGRNEPRDAEAVSSTEHVGGHPIRRKSAHLTGERHKFIDVAWPPDTSSQRH